MREMRSRNRQEKTMSFIRQILVEYQLCPVDKLKMVVERVAKNLDMNFEKYSESVYQYRILDTGTYREYLTIRMEAGEATVAIVDDKGGTVEDQVKIETWKADPAAMIENTCRAMLRRYIRNAEGGKFMAIVDTPYKPVSEDMEVILGTATRYPTSDLLRQLADAAEILLHHHAYDGHGYEGIQYCMNEARERAAHIDATHAKMWGMSLAEYLKRRGK
jgi:hypothetical protein